MDNSDAAAKALAQKQMLLQQQQQQQYMLLQQMQQQQQQNKTSSAISRFPSNIDAHLLPQRNLQQQQQQQQQNPNPSRPNSANVQQNQHKVQGAGAGASAGGNVSGSNSGGGGGGVTAANQVELQMAYQDALRVCRPDFKRPFSSLEDACERLLPYHVVADYEAEEDDRILDSDTTGKVLSRSQQWDHNIATKVAEFTATFEKQVQAFNIISQKRAIGEFRSEERLMIEQALLQEEKRALMEARAELQARQKAGQNAMRIAAMAQAEQQAHAEMVARAPIRGSAVGTNISVAEQEQDVNPDEDMMNGWANNAQRDEKEPSEDFLNDEERENGDAGTQSEWRGEGEFDLNAR